MNYLSPRRVHKYLCQLFTIKIKIISFCSFLKFSLQEIKTFQHFHPISSPFDEKKLRFKKNTNTGTQFLKILTIVLFAKSKVFQIFSNVFK